MKQFKELREFKTALSFFDLKSATKAERLAKSMGILKDSQYKNKQYTVFVDGKFTDITKWLKKLDTSEQVNEQVISEALSKKISDAEARKIQKKYNLAMDQFQDLKNDYSPAKTARPKAWISLDYPVRDGDYYFAFVADDEKKNTKFNSKLNDILRNVGRGRIVGGANKKQDLLKDVWAGVSVEVKKFPKDLGWGDTMTREEIYNSILHMIAYPGVKEEIDEVTVDKMRVGRRQKAPKYESVIGESDANWAKSLEKIQKQRQLDKISDKDKETIMKIAALLGKEKKRR